MQTSIECILRVRHGTNYISITSFEDRRNKMEVNILKILNKGIGQVAAKHSSKHQI